MLLASIERDLNVRIRDLEEEVRSLKQELNYAYEELDKETDQNLFLNETIKKLTKEG